MPVPNFRYVPGGCFYVGRHTFWQLSSLLEIRQRKNKLFFFASQNFEISRFFAIVLQWGPGLKESRLVSKPCFLDFPENFATLDSCNFVPTGPISMFLVPRMCSSSWKARKCHRWKGIFCSNNFLVRWGSGGFLTCRLFQNPPNRHLTKKWFEQKISFRR